LAVRAAATGQFEHPRHVTQCSGMNVRRELLRFRFRILIINKRYICTGM
jgi:hypothetical protein